MNSRPKKSKAVLFPPTIFNVKKPKGQTTTDIVNYFKRNLPQGFGKIGHFGTLDPFAEGVVMIGIAGASRLNDFVHEHLPKTYLAKGIIGERTDTADLTGTIVEKIDLADPRRGYLEQLSLEELNQFCQQKFCDQEYWQVPPAYSAVKHEGKALYAYAREGINIVKPAVKRDIFKLEVISKNEFELELRATVGSGTYIRTLFEDILKEYGLVGHLTELTRESIGQIHADQGLSQEIWPKRDEPFSVDEQGLDVRYVLPFDQLQLPDDLVRPFSQGVRLPTKNICMHGVNIARPFWVCSKSNDLLGLAKIEDEGLCVLINFYSILRQ